MPEGIINLWDSITESISSILPVDVLDIVCVSFLLYVIYKFIRDRRAGKLAVGILFLLAFLGISEFLNMHVMQYFLKNVFQIGIIALVIVFQPELRDALEQVGGNSIKGIINIAEQRNKNISVDVIGAVCEACVDMSESRTGALIVFERTLKLKEQILAGTELDAEVSVKLLENIFYNKSPLHDGAVIIASWRINTAGSILPISSNVKIINVGTRHRAALGISEKSDAIAVVVSEETGIISLAHDGQLDRGFNEKSLCEELEKLLMIEGETGVRNLRSRFGSRKEKSFIESDSGGDDSEKK